MESPEGDVNAVGSVDFLHDREHVRLEFTNREAGPMFLAPSARSDVKQQKGAVSLYPLPFARRYLGQLIIKLSQSVLPLPCRKRDAVAHGAPCPREEDDGWRGLSRPRP